MKKDSIRRLGAILGWLFSFCAVCLVLGLLVLVPSGKTGVTGSKTIDTAGQFDTDLHNLLSDALSSVTSVKKRYWIASNAPAPVPDQSCYGSAADPKELKDLLEQARDVLEGQTFYFDPESTEILPGSEIQYYYDETILAITWKEAHKNMAVTCAEVKIMDISQFRRYLAGEEFGCGKLMLSSEMAEAAHAVVGCSADFYGFRPDGVMILDGIALRANRALPDLCFIKKNGDMLLYRGNDFSSVEYAQRFADENEIVFSFSFGPVLIKDGKRCERYDYPIGELDRNYARSALCQLGTLHYLYTACNREPPFGYTPDIGELTTMLLDMGVQQAYNLDGGQTTTVVMNNQVVNTVNYGNQRKISDILYFATAKPSGG